MTRPRHEEPLIDIGQLLATLELTLAELHTFTDELRDEVARAEDD